MRSASSESAARERRDVIAFHPLPLGTIAIGVRIDRLPKAARRSSKIQAKSVPEIDFLAMEKSPPSLNRRRQHDALRASTAHLFGLNNAQNRIAPFEQSPCLRPRIKIACPTGPPTDPGEQATPPSLPAERGRWSEV